MKKLLIAIAATASLAACDDTKSPDLPDGPVEQIPPQCQPEDVGCIEP